jgi:multidrug resistance efflux pump
MRLTTTRLTLLAGLAIATGAIAVTTLRSHRIRSVDAVIDGTLVTVRAPEAGIVHREPLKKGASIAQGSPIAWIEPPSEDSAVTAPAPLPFGISGGFSHPILVRGTGVQGKIAEVESRLLALKQQLKALQSASTPPSRPEAAPTPVDLSSYERAVDSAQAEVQAAEAIEATAKKAAERAEFLFKEGAIARKEVEQAQREQDRAGAETRGARTKLERAQGALADAKSRADSPVEPPPPAQNNSATNALKQEIGALEKTLAQLRKQPTTVSRVLRPKSIQGNIGNEPLKPFVPDVVTNDLKGTKLNAPNGGVVWDVPIVDGAKVAANAPLLKVLLADDVWVQAAFRPSDAKALRLGSAVHILIGSASYTGTIDSIGAEPFWSTVSQERAGRQFGLIPVKVKVDWPASTLRDPLRQAGTSVQVELVD